MVFYIHLSITICIIAPFDPNPNDGGFGVGGSVEEEEGNDGAIVGIIFGVIFGIVFIIIIIVFCKKMLKEFFKGCFESIYECLACCLGGCLSFLKLFDIRQYFGNEDNGYVNNIVAVSCIVM